MDAVGRNRVAGDAVTLARILNIFSYALPFLAATAMASIVLEGTGYFPVQVRLRNGDLLAVVRGGDSHVGVKGRLDLVTSRDGGKHWSSPWTAVDGAEDDRNPALGQLRDGTVLLAFAVARNYDESGRNFKGPRAARVFDGVYVMRSRDNGRSWSPPVRSEAIHSSYVGKGVVSPYGKIVQLRDGSALMAVYFEFFDGRGFESHLYRSRDGGVTWGEPSIIGKGFNETGLVVLPNGDVLAGMRSGKEKSIWVARSKDEGRTFGEARPITKEMQHPADLITLRDGRVLLTYGERNAPRGVQAVVSSDNGATWGAPIVLVSDAPNVDCGYPSSVQLNDGQVVTMYYQVNDERVTPGSAQARAVVWRVPAR